MDPSLACVRSPCKARNRAAASGCAPLVNKHLLSAHHSVPGTCARGSGEGQAEACPSGARRQPGKTVGPVPSPGRGNLLMLCSDPFYSFTGAGTEGTWYEYPRWLGCGAAG